MLITRKRSAQAVGSGVKERNALARGSGTAKYISDSLGQATIEYETQNEGKNSGSGISGGGGSMNRGKSAGSSQQFTGRQPPAPIQSATQRTAEVIDLAAWRRRKGKAKE